MPRRPDPVPKYLRHSSGQARVRLRDSAGRRRDYLLGPYDSPESRAEYERVLALLRVGRTPWAGAPDPAAGLTVAEVLLRYWRHAQAYYANPKVRDNVRLAIRPARVLYGPLPAAEFSPLKLKAVRDALLAPQVRVVRRQVQTADGPRLVEQTRTYRLARAVVNQRVGVIKRVFKWAVAEELVPAAVHQALQAVAGLKKGRTAAREPDPVRPVPDAWVDAVLPHVLPPVRAMIELQRLTGARAGELVIMRPCDLDVTGDVWLYRPAHHKTEHHEKDRVIAIGPKARAVLAPFLPPDLTAYVFSPARAMAERAKGLRAARRSKVPPSQLARGLGRNRRRPPGERYTVTNYRNAIRRACDRADRLARQQAEEGQAKAEGREPAAVPAKVADADRIVPRWHPHRLRHSRLTAIRRRYGLEAAQVVAGHARADVTEVYAEADVDLALRVAREVG